MFAVEETIPVDTIRDFELGRDKLYLSERVWGGGLSASQVVTRFGSVTLAGVILDFGTGPSTILEDVDSLIGLENDLRTETGAVLATAVKLSYVEVGTGGFVNNGVSSGDNSGSSVGGAGDFTGAATQVGTVNADLLTGSVANDVIFAGIGDDSIDGGGGTDRLSGGQGADVLIFRNLEGTTSVIDFEGPEGDLLDISDFNFANFAAVQGVVSASGPGGHDTRIDLDADTVVILEGVTTDTLTADDFLLL